MFILKPAMNFKDYDQGNDNVIHTYSLHDDKDTDDRDDENDDALSLCNLSMYCDAADQSFDRASSSSSSSSSSDHLDDDDDDFFEFSSTEDFSSSAPREIVFCGKLISHVETTPPSSLSEAARTKSSSLQTCHNKSHQNTSKSDQRPFKRPGRWSIRGAKRRWYFYAFGLARFPTEMALSEMKARQNRSRRLQSNIFGSSNGGGGGGEIVSGGGVDDRRSRGAGKGWLGLLKALGLGSRSHQQHAGAVVKASFGCIPRV